MLTYYQRTCDKSGAILREEKLEASGLRHAMAQASSRISSMVGSAGQTFDPRGRIEITDRDGHPVARIYCAEVLPPVGTRR